MQRHNPHQLAVDQLLGGLTQIHLAAQRRTLAQLLIRQVGCQCLIHNGKLALIHDLDVAGEGAHFRVTQLIPIGLGAKNRRRQQRNQDQQHPRHSDHSKELFGSAAGELHRIPADAAIADGNDLPVAEHRIDAQIYGDEEAPEHSPFKVHGVEVGCVHQHIEHHQDGEHQVDQIAYLILVHII